MNNNKFGYARTYMEQSEIEEYISSRLDEKYKNKPIKLTDVEFNKFDGSIDFHFIVFVGDSNEDIKSRWNCDRLRMSFADIIINTKKEEVNKIPEPKFENMENTLREDMKNILLGSDGKLSYKRLQKSIVELFDIIEGNFAYVLENKMLKEDGAFNNAEIKFEWLGDQNNFVKTHEDGKGEIVCTQPKQYTVKGIYSDIDRFIKGITSIIEFFDVWYNNLRYQIIETIEEQRKLRTKDSKLRVYVDGVRFKESEIAETDAMIDYDMMVKVGIMLA